MHQLRKCSIDFLDNTPNKYIGGESHCRLSVDYQHIFLKGLFNNCFMQHNLTHTYVTPTTINVSTEQKSFFYHPILTPAQSCS